MEKRRQPEARPDVEFAGILVLMFIAGVIAFTAGYLIHGVI